MGKLICTVELDKTDGITVKVENNDDKIVQTFHLDGTQIKTTVAGNDATSTITQKQDSVKVECKDFTVLAETITCKSTKATLHHSDDTFDITATKDLTEKSDAKVVVKATGDATVDGANVKITAQTDVKLAGVNVKGEASAAAGLKGAQLALEGSATADLKGAKTTVKADALLDAGGSITKLSGVVQLAGGGPPMMIG